MNIYWVFLTVLEMGLTASVVILAVLFARGIMCRLPKKYVYIMWLVVGIRLVCPVAVSSPVSVFNLLGVPEKIAQQKSVTWGILDNSIAQVSFGEANVQEDGKETRDVSESVKEGSSQNSIAGANSDSVPTSGQKDSSDVSDASQDQGDALAKDANETEAAGSGIAASQNVQKDVDRQAPFLNYPVLKREIQIGTIVWIAGVIILLLWNTVLTIRMKKRLRKAVRYEGNVYECDAIPSPFVLGLLNPRIYIPFRLNEQEREYILRHERYHIRRRDHLTKFIAVLLTIVYWFHPLVWVAYFCMVRDMEMSCDEYVLGSMEQDIRGKYSASLLGFATNKRHLSPEFLAFGETDTRKRVRNIMRFQKQKKKIGFLAVALVLVVGVVCLTNSMDLTKEKERDGKEKETNSTVSRTEDGRYRVHIASETIHDYQLQLVYLSDTPEPKAGDLGVFEGAFALVTSKDGTVCDEYTLQFEGVGALAFPSDGMSLVVKDYDGDQAADDFSLGQGQTVLPAMGNYMQYKFFTVDEDGSITRYTILDTDQDHIVTMPGDYSGDFTYEDGWLQYQGFNEESLVSTMTTSLVRKVSIGDNRITESSPEKEIWENISRTMPLAVVKELQEKGVWNIYYGMDENSSMVTYYSLENASETDDITLRMKFMYNAEGEMIQYVSEDNGFLDGVSSKDREGKTMDTVISFAKDFFGLQLEKAKLTDQSQKKEGEMVVESAMIEFADGKSGEGRVGVWKDRAPDDLDGKNYAYFSDMKGNHYYVSLKQNMVVQYEAAPAQNTGREAESVSDFDAGADLKKIN